MKYSRKISSGLVLSILLVFSACSSGGGNSSGGSTIPPAKKEVSYELEKGTVLVGNSQTKEMTSIPEINASNYKGNLDFKAPNSGAFAKYKVGDTLISGVTDNSPNGFLRKITNIQNVGGELVISTEQGKLLEATNNLHIDYSSSNITPDKISSIQLSKGVVLENMKLDKSGKILAASTTKGNSLFDISIDHTFTHNGGDVTVKGRTTFDFGIIFKLETEWLVVPEYFKSSIVIDQGTKISINSNNGVNYNQKISIGLITLAPISLGPVVIVPTINLVLEANGQVQANFALSASESFHGEIGEEYKRSRSPSWKPIKEKTSKTDYALPNLENINANIKVDAGPEFSLMVYGIVGPYMFLNGFGDFKATVTTAPNVDLSLDVGVAYKLGVKVDVLWVDENYALVSDDLFRINVLKLEDKPVPNAIYLTDPMENEFILYGPVKKVKAVYSGVDPAKIDFLLDGTKIGSDNTKPYEIAWDTNTSSLGFHTLKVVSYDNSGNKIAEDNTSLDLREAKWREGSISGTTLINESDFLYGTGYTFEEDGGNAVIQETTNGGKTWHIFYEKPMGLASGPFEKGLISPNGSVIALEVLSRDLFAVNASGRTGLFGGFSGDYTGVRDFGLNNSGEIIALLDKGGYPYIAKISNSGSGVATELAAVEDNSGNPGSFGKTAIEFSKVSEDAIVYGMKAINMTTGAMNSGFMISHNGGGSWSWKDFNGVDFGFLETLDGACFISTNKIVLVGTISTDETDYSVQIPALHIVPNSAFVLITTDGGDTWQRIEVPNAKGFSSVTFINDQEGFASVNGETDTAQPKVYKTVNGGLTWAPVDETSTKERIVKVQFSNEYSGMAVGNKGTVFRFALD